VNASRISCLNLTLLFGLFVFLVCRLMSGAFTMGSAEKFKLIAGNLPTHSKNTIDCFDDNQKPTHMPVNHTRKRLKI
jgi:hypothetical protein